MTRPNDILADDALANVAEAADFWPGQMDDASSITASLNGVLTTSDDAQNLCGGRKHFGKYRIVRPIGQGGMGLVFEAIDESLERRVALKVLPPAALSDAMNRRRFENEYKTIAQLDHEAIVDVYGCGREGDFYYFAMKLFEGRDLRQVIKSLRSDVSTADASIATRTVAQFSTAHDAVAKHIKSSNTLSGSNTHAVAGHQISADDYGHERSPGLFNGKVRIATVVAEIGAKVADALHHAHEKDILHRDIKPSNLLLDERGNVCITDFGLARNEQTPSVTQTGIPIGTLRFMSPEQATGGASQIDRRSDIYSLGATLFELLTLQPLVEETSTGNILNQVCSGQVPYIRSIDPDVPEDLAVIIEKSLAKDPDDRYSTALELAQDLQRFLNREPIVARRPSLQKQFRFWVNQHRILTTSIAIGIACTLLTSFIAGAMVLKSWQNETASRQSADEATSEVAALQDLDVGIALIQSNPAKALKILKRVAMVISGPQVDKALQAAEAANREYVNVSVGPTVRSTVAVSPDGKHAVSSVTKSAFGHGSFPAFVRSTTSGDLLLTLDSGQCITSAAYSPSSRYILTASAPQPRDIGDGLVPLSGPPVLWDALTGQQLQTFKDFTLRDAAVTTFDPDGDRIVLCEGNHVVVYSIADQQIESRLTGHTAPVTYAEFSPDGSRILTISEDGTVRAWNVATGLQSRPAVKWYWKGEQPVRSLHINATFTADSQQLLVREWDAVRMYSAQVSDGSESRPVHTRTDNTWMAVSRSLDLIATYNAQMKHVYVVSSLDFGKVCSFEVQGKVFDARFHPVLPQVAILSQDKIYLYHAETGELISELKGHERFVLDVAMSATDPRLVSVSNDRTFRCWQTESRRSEPPLLTGKTSDVEWKSLSATLSSDDRLVALPTQMIHHTQLLEEDGSDWGTAFDGLTSEGLCDSHNLVTWNERTVHVTEPTSGKEIYEGDFLHPIDSGTRMVAGGCQLLVCTRDRDSLNRQAWLVNPKTRTRTAIADSSEAIGTLAVTPDGAQLLVGIVNGGAFMADAFDGHRLNHIPVRDSIIDAAYADSGERFAVVDSSHQVHVFDRSFKKIVSLPRSADGQVNRVSFHADGVHVITWQAVGDTLVQCWNTTTGQPVASLEVEGDTIVACDRHLGLVAVGSDKGTRLWNPLRNTHSLLCEDPCRSLSSTGNSFAILTKFGVPRGGDEQASCSKLLIWSVPENRMLCQRALTGSGFRVSADAQRNRYAVTETEFNCRIVDVYRSERSMDSMPHPAPLLLTGFAAESNSLVTVSTDGTIRVTDSQGRLSASALAPGTATTTAALDPGGRHLLTASDDGRLILWKTEELLQASPLTGNSGTVHSIRFSSDGNCALTASDDDTVQTWNLNTGTCVSQSIPQPHHAELSPDGSHALALSADGTTHLIHISDQKAGVVRQFGGIRAAVFSPDGERFALLTTAGELQIHSLSEPSTESTVNMRGELASRLAFSQDGKLVVTDHGTHYVCWDIHAGEVSLRVSQGTPSPAPVHDLSISWQPFNSRGELVVAQDGRLRRYSPNNSFARYSPNGASGRIVANVDF
jgi:serine/threonine protein kinase/dipeptidyl aminopeptidase/acylaminoacyl peptidase